MESQRKNLTQISEIQSDGEGSSFSLLTRGIACSAGKQSGVSRRQFIGSALAVTAGAVFSRASEPRRWQIGCYTRPWAQYDYRVALDGIAAAGFKYAGLMTTKSENHLVISLTTTPEEAAAIGGEAKQRGLKIISLYPGEFPTDNTDGLKRLIDNCAACGCPNMLLGGTDEGHADAYYKTVTECCDYAAAKGVGLNLKTHGGTNANGAMCRKIIDRIGHKNLRVWYDPGNVFFHSEGKLDPVDDAAAVKGAVVGMSIKDFRPPKDVDLTPGTGKVNFAKVLSRLKQGGFTHGPLVVECLDPGDLAHINAEAVKARRFVEALTHQKA